jgi:hypothetical protein
LEWRSTRRKEDLEGEQDYKKEKVQSNLSDERGVETYEKRVNSSA